jgi:hypothetical protein
MAVMSGTPQLPRSLPILLSVRTSKLNVTSTTSVVLYDFRISMWILAPELIGFFRYGLFATAKEPGAMT